MRVPQAPQLRVQMLSLSMTLKPWTDPRQAQRKGKRSARQEQRVKERPKIRQKNPSQSRRQIPIQFRIRNLSRHRKKTPMRSKCDLADHGARHLLSEQDLEVLRLLERVARYVNAAGVSLFCLILRLWQPTTSHRLVIESSRSEEPLLKLSKRNRWVPRRKCLLAEEASLHTLHLRFDENATPETHHSRKQKINLARRAHPKASLLNDTFLACAILS